MYRNYDLKANIDSKLKFHDFRVVKGVTHTNVLFDVVMPITYPKTPQELKEQFPIAKEICEAMGIHYFEIDNYEADDIIGTFAKEVNKNIGEVIAFDTGPGNILIDAAMRRLFRKDFDDCGKIAKRGHVVDEVLQELMNDPYLHQKAPKSTGREKYSEAYLSEIIIKVRGLGGSDSDIIATLAAYTADCIIFSYFIEKFFLQDR